MVNQAHDEIFYIDEFIPEKFFPVVKELVSHIDFRDGEVFGKMFSGYGHVTLPLKSRLEDELGQPVEFVMSHVRLGRKSTPLTHFIHADNEAAEYALVWCVSAPECSSGTAFWKHKETGDDRLTLPCPKELFDCYDKDVQDETKWDMIAYVESKPNRAVVFNSSLFHSRYPKELPVSEDETPRIVCTIFFNTVGE